MLKKVVVVFVLIVGGFLAFAATQPGTYHVERSADIEAPAAIVFAELDDFHNWQAWSPWEKMDPAMKKTFEGPAGQVGSSYAWEGNKDVGKGRMSVTAVEAPRRIEYKLEFIEPFAAVASNRFSLAGETTQKVTWSMDGDKSFPAKVMGIFMDMDAAIGKDFEAGLLALKSVSETKAKAAAEEAARTQAEAEAAAQAEAAAAAEAEAAAKIAAEAEAAKGKGKGKRKAK
ncbi:MAG: SRPBCC family protein [Myxococcales bacterium]|nr:SRPBCC family protein [Myxococcales bacterium]